MDDKLKEEINALLRKLQKEGVRMTCLAEHEDGLLHMANSAAYSSNSPAFNTVKTLMECNGSLNEFLSKVGASFDEQDIPAFLKKPSKTEIDNDLTIEFLLKTNPQLILTQH